MTEPLLLAALLILLRISAFVAFLPAPFGRGTPATVKIGLAVALTASSAAIVAPAAAVRIAGGLTGAAVWVWLAYLAMREVVLGVAMGWLFGQMTVPARIAGAYVSQEMGFTLGAITSSHDQRPTDVLSELFEGLAVLLILGLNLHYVWIAAIGQSLTSHPIADRWQFPAPAAVIDVVSRTGALGILIIAPVVILMFLALVTLLMTSRTTPQFNLLSYGMTFRVLAGMGAVALFLPEIVAGLMRSVQLLHLFPVR